MDGGAAELFCGHRFVCHRLHHVGSCHEHVARVAHHEDEIRHCGGIDVTARARPHDDGDLRDDAGGQHIALEHFAIAAERIHPLLDARPSRIEQADDGRPVLQRHVLDLGDLARMRLGERSAEDGVKSLAKT